MLAQDFNELGYITNQWPLDPQRPTLMLVHGAGMNHAQWQYQMLALQQQANLVAVDLPGHALSAHHDGDQSIPRYADTLAELATELASEQLILAGHSMGGAVCLEFAMRHPDQLSGLVLLNTGARLRVEQQLLQQISDDYPAFIRQLTRNALSDDSSDQLSQQFAELLMQSESDAILNDFTTCDHFDRLDEVSTIQCPALVISSDQDRMTPPKYGQYLADQLEQGEFTLIEGAAHISPMEQPDAVNAAISQFLQRF